METSPTGAIGRQTWVQLVAIVFLASILRVWGLAYCLPHPIGRPDEQVTTFNALRMFANRTLAPGDWWYPSLQKYLAVGALHVHYAITRLTGRCASLEEFVEYVTIIHPGLYYLTCRAVSVLTGVATVPVVFLLGRRVVGDDRAGVIAALFLAVSYLHVRDSHFATVDITMTFFTTSCLLLSLEAARTGRLSLFSAAGVAGGFAGASKYNAATACVAVAAAAACRLREGSSLDVGLMIRRILVGAASAVAAFLVAVPYAISARATMFEAMTELAAVLSGGDSPTGFTIFPTHSLPGGLGYPLYVAGVAGIVHLVWRRRCEDCVWLSFAVLFFCLVGSLRWVFPRYVLPLVPILAVGAADVVLMVFRRGRAIGGIVVLLLCALPTLWRSIQFDRVAGRPDTRVAAADWIAANVPAQSRIALCEGYGAPVLHGNRPGRMPFLPKTITCSRAVINSSRADYLVTHEHPVLRFSAPVGHYEALLDGRWQPLASFDPRSGAAIQRTDYDPSDAFYVPYTNLEAVTRGGPLITVWARSETSADGR